MAPGQSKPKLKRMILQSRDLDLLQALGTASTLDTNVIWHRHFPNDKTGQSCRRRLNLLAQHGLVLRTFIEVSSALGNGRAPILYNLTPKGAKAVEDDRAICNLRTAHGDRLSPKTIRHRAGIGELVLTITDACIAAHLPAPEWLLEYDVQPNAAKGSSFSNRFFLCQQFKGTDGTRQICWPDCGCEITVLNGPTISRLVLLFEYDRSTEDLPQLTAKLPPYATLFSKRTYRQWWPDAADAYLFFVFQTETRLRNAAAAFAKEKMASRIRMAVVSDLNDHSPITDPIWFTVSLERRALLSQNSTPTKKPSSS